MARIIIFEIIFDKREERDDSGHQTPANTQQTWRRLVDGRRICEIITKTIQHCYLKDAIR